MPYPHPTPAPDHPEWEALGFAVCEGLQVRTWRKRIALEAGYFDLEIRYKTRVAYAFFYEAVVYDHREAQMRATVEVFEQPGEIMDWLAAVMG